MEDKKLLFGGVADINTLQLATDAFAEHSLGHIPLKIQDHREDADCALSQPPPVLGHLGVARVHQLKSHEVPWHAPRLRIAEGTVHSVC